MHQVLVECSVLVGAPGRLMMLLAYVVLKRRRDPKVERKEKGATPDFGCHIFQHFYFFVFVFLQIFLFREILAKPVFYVLLSAVPALCIISQVGMSLYDDHSSYGIPFVESNPNKTKKNKQTKRGRKKKKDTSFSCLVLIACICRYFKLLLLSSAVAASYATHLVWFLWHHYRHQQPSMHAETSPLLDHGPGLVKELGGGHTTSSEI